MKGNLNAYLEPCGIYKNINYKDNFRVKKCTCAQHYTSLLMMRFFSFSFFFFKKQTEIFFEFSSRHSKTFIYRFEPSILVSSLQREILTPSGLRTCCKGGRYAFFNCSIDSE